MLEIADAEAQTFPDSVVVLRASNGSVVYLVGTRQYSEESQEDVAKVINAVKPDYVCLELCQNRTDLLEDEETDIANNPSVTLSSLKESIKHSGFALGLFEEFLSSTSVKMSRDLGMVSGEEFRRAVAEAKKYDSNICLGDRLDDITLKRVISVLSWSQIIKLLANNMFTKDKYTREDVEEFINYGNMPELSSVEDCFISPEIQNVLVDERDKFLTYSLQFCAGIEIKETGLEPNSISSRPLVVVGVVGAAHVAGIQKYWETISLVQIAELTMIPPESRSSKIIKFVATVSFSCLLLWGISKIPVVKNLPKMVYGLVS